jgi:hypothetical protein
MARTSTDTAARATKTTAPLIICFLLSILLTIYNAFYAINNNHMTHMNNKTARLMSKLRKYAIDLINRKYIATNSCIEQHILQEKREFHCKIDVHLKNEIDRDY